MCRCSCRERAIRVYYVVVTVNTRRLKLKQIGFEMRKKSNEHFWKRQRLRSASRQLLDVPRYGLSSFARRAFSVAGPSVWNSLPEYLRDQAVGRDSFRKQLKAFLFATY